MCRNVDTITMQSKFAAIVRHCLTLLTYRVDTIEIKLVQLHHLLSAETVVDKSIQVETGSNINTLGSSIDIVTIPGPSLCGNEASILNENVSESTLSIAHQRQTVFIDVEPQQFHYM